MWSGLKQTIEEKFNFKLNKNQFKEIKRLIYEINRRENLTGDKIINTVAFDTTINRISGRNKFFRIKDNLIKMRFPLTRARQTIDTKQVFLAELKTPLENNARGCSPFKPEKIFIEKSAANSYLAGKFTRFFPETPIEELNYYGEHLKKQKYSLEDLKKPYVFIVNEQWDFIKPCPCTKEHLGCNYWIFNLGMGCPFDCSYCFLQQYSNFPGIVLPSNLDVFFNRFDNFHKKIGRPIRIGTGEFSDSLALDYITDYAGQLINFFKTKPVYFELKTKSPNIDNIKEINGEKNIVISWSLNPQTIIDSEEIATSSLIARLEAARQMQKQGFSLSFHFDPIIYSPDWKTLYKNTVDKLYKKINGPFAWISLGTLRGTRKLKSTAELRFPKSNIFYGELLLGKDKKLRYHEFLRKEIYQNMVHWIRAYDTKTPIYLCMENKNIWQVVNNDLNTSGEIERYLIKNTAVIQSDEKKH
ncbi:MAG: radical SAM protein [Candidatus Omnitrophota bacterium]